MSKKSKANVREKRRSDKRARKATQRARYEGYIKAGKNTKSKRSELNIGSNKLRARSHPNGQCGNFGCIRCYGIHYKGFIKQGKPYRMPQWMWLRWVDLGKDKQKQVIQL